jgi:hypothetical protein
MTEPAIRGLVLWTIYNRPADHSDGYVARRFVAENGKAHPTEHVLASDDLDILRQMLAEHGLICLGRAAEDAPHIVGTWAQ